MPSINSVVLMGRITADPEMKQTTSGVSVTSFTLAVDRKYTREGAAQTDFIPVIAWRGTAEFICRNFSKGAMMIVEGEIQTRSWTDGQGRKQYKTEVVASEASFGETKRISNGSNATISERDAQGAASPSYGYASHAASPSFETMSADDDLPF